MKELTYNELNGNIPVLIYKPKEDEMEPPILIRRTLIDRDGDHAFEYSFLGYDSWMGVWTKKYDNNVKYFLIEDIQVLEKILQTSIENADKHVRCLEDMVRDLELFTINKKMEYMR